MKSESFQPKLLSYSCITLQLEPFFLSWPCIFSKSWPYGGVLMKWWIGFCPTRERQLNISCIKFRETKTYPVWGFLDRSASALYIFNDNVVSNSVLFSTKSKLTHGEKYCLILFSPHFPPHFRLSACAVGGGVVYNTVWIHSYKY